LNGREQEVEYVPEQDQLIDVLEVRLERIERKLVPQQRLAGPSAEVHIGDR
jgi:hypothetical protein